MEVFCCEKWKEVDPAQPFVGKKGSFRVRLSQPGTVICENATGQGPVGYGTDIKAAIYGDYTLTVIAPKGTRVWVYDPSVTLLEPQGEVFTNIDRQPMESGALYEVSKALRLLKLESQAATQKIRAATRKLKLERAQRGHEATETEQQPEEVKDDSDQTTEEKQNADG